MSSVSLSPGLSNVLITCDHLCDYIPVISTITNLFLGIIEKLVLGCFNKDSLKENHYFSYIKHKSLFRCFILLVPVLGNILIGIYDFNQRKPKEENDFDFIARIQGIDVSSMSRSDYENNLVKAQDMINAITDTLDYQIRDLEETLNDFQSSTMPPKTINEQWNEIKTSFREINKQNLAFESRKLDKHPKIIPRLQKILELKKSFIAWRQAYYQKHIDHLIREIILKEANRYYLSTNLENDPLFKPLEAESGEKLMPAMFKRIEDLTKCDKEYLIVELKILYPLFVSKSFLAK